MVEKQEEREERVEVRKLLGKFEGLEVKEV